MRGEVLRLDAALAQTQRQMAAMATTKAAKSELAAVRTAVTRFLFGTAPPAPAAPPTPAPPTPSYPPPALPPADALATLQAAYAEPRPPPFKPAAAGTRPRPTRPSTARARHRGPRERCDRRCRPTGRRPGGAPPGVGAHRAHRRPHHGRAAARRAAARRAAAHAGASCCSRQFHRGARADRALRGEGGVGAAHRGRRWSRRRGGWTTPSRRAVTRVTESPQGRRQRCRVSPRVAPLVRG